LNDRDRQSSLGEGAIQGLPIKDFSRLRSKIAPFFAIRTKYLILFSVKGNAGGKQTDILEVALLIAIGVLAGLLLIWALSSSLIIIQEYETGVYMRLGRFVKNLGPGLHLVAPFVSKVYRADRRIQTMDLGRLEVMTSDLSPVTMEAMIQYTLQHPDQSLLKIDKYKTALNQISQALLRKMVLTRDLETLIRGQEQFNSEFMKRLVPEGERYGVRIERTEIRDIDPVGPIKAAMEDRVAAERERQAMILRADGRRKALMMEREGRGA